MNNDFKRLVEDFGLRTEDINSDNATKFSTVKGTKSFGKTDIEFKIETSWVDTHKQIKVLFAHFPPFKNELEALDFPVFFKKIFPNSKVDLSYDKGSQIMIFDLEGNAIRQKSNLEEKYDLIIGRSSVFFNMYNRANHRKIVENCPKKIQIKPMGLKKNMLHVDFIFEDKFLFCPPSPVFRRLTREYMSRKEKEKIILFLGKVGKEKNQLSYIKNLSDNNISEYSIVCLGNNTSESDYAREIRENCKKRKINLYMIDQVPHHLVPLITSLSKLHVINCDPRPFGQPYDPIPRCIGEAAFSNCHSLVSKTTLYNEEMSKFLFEYDHENNKSINLTFEKAQDIDASNYYKELITLEEKCMSIIRKIDV